MKSFTSILFLMVFLFSCQTDTISIEPKVFSGNDPGRNSSFKLVITNEGGLVKAVRSQDRIVPGEQNTVMYLETNNVFLDEKGFIRVKDQNIKVWFIPYVVGGGVHLLNSGNCYRYYCNCDGLPGPETSACAATTWGDGSIRCREAGERTCQNDLLCTGTAANVPCNAAGDEVIEYLSSGVIVEAESVTVQDPDWYKPSPHTPLIFKMADDGGAIIDPKTLENIPKAKAEQN